LVSQFVCLFVFSFVRSFVLSFIRSFVCSLDIANTLLNPAVSTLHKAVHSFYTPSVLRTLSICTEAHITTGPYVRVYRQTDRDRQTDRLLQWDKQGSW